MDTYRGHFGDRASDDTPDVEFGNFDFGDADSGEHTAPPEPPPSPIGQDERRMQVRAYNHWASLLDNRNFPSVEDLDPAQLPDFGPHSVLLDFTAGVANPTIQYLGATLAEECGTDARIETLADVPSRSLLSRITDHYMQILANQAPIGFEAEFVNQRERTILYRGILLPFSSDNDTIDFIYGVINWKELADQQATDELLLEIDQALAGQSARTAQSAGSAPLTGWADGPADQHDDALDLGAFASLDDHADLGASDFDEDAMELADWLASARELAELARGTEDRTRNALYAAISRAHDFALAAAVAPADFAELVSDAGLTVQTRAPLTPVVKLVFGADYDKTRLTEYASALAHAQRLELPRGTLGQFLAHAHGGLKGVVAEERKLKRAETGKSAPVRTAPREALARKLRKLDHHALAQATCADSEFSLLVARRLASGEVVLLGEVNDDPALLERAARRLLG